MLAVGLNKFEFGTSDHLMRKFQSIERVNNQESELVEKVDEPINYLKPQLNSKVDFRKNQSSSINPTTDEYYEKNSLNPSFIKEP